MTEVLWNVAAIMLIMSLGGVIFVAAGMFIVGMLGFVDD